MKRTYACMLDLKGDIPEGAYICICKLYNQTIKLYCVHLSSSVCVNGKA